jgi:hypothetical protein
MQHTGRDALRDVEQGGGQNERDGQDGEKG